jgi:RNA polymerase sigma factor (sigma-70 family)
MPESLNAVTLYFNDIKNLPKASPDEMVVLWEKAKKGNKTASRRLAELNLRLVIPITRKYYRSGVDFLDLVEEGNLGLIHAVEKFDPQRGFRFSTYAAYWIEQAVRRARDEQSKTIRIPLHSLEILRKWLREWESLRLLLGRTPTLQEMGKKMHLSVRQVKGVLDTHEASKSIASLDSPLDEDENLFLRDTVADTTEKSPEQLFSFLRTHDELGAILHQLVDRERGILEMRFGLNGGDSLNLEEIGRKLKLSRERVRQLEERGLACLRRIAHRIGWV